MDALKNLSTKFVASRTRNKTKFPRQNFVHQGHICTQWETTVQDKEFMVWGRTDTNLMLLVHLLRESHSLHHTMYW